MPYTERGAEESARFPGAPVPYCNRTTGGDPKERSGSKPRGYSRAGGSMSRAARGVRNEACLETRAFLRNALSAWPNGRACARSILDLVVGRCIHHSTFTEMLSMTGDATRVLKLLSRDVCVVDERTASSSASECHRPGMRAKQTSITYTKKGGEPAVYFSPFEYAPRVPPMQESTCVPP